jgi:hypothetical protein
MLIQALVPQPTVERLNQAGLPAASTAQDGTTTHSPMSSQIYAWPVVGSGEEAGCSIFWPSSCAPLNAASVLRVQAGKRRRHTQQPAFTSREFISDDGYAIAGLTPAIRQIR